MNSITAVRPVEKSLSRKRFTPKKSKFSTKIEELNEISDEKGTE
jgi:hypothetical protein